MVSWWYESYAMAHRYHRCRPCEQTNKNHYSNHRMGYISLYQNGPCFFLCISRIDGVIMSPYHVTVSHIITISIKYYIDIKGHSLRDIILLRNTSHYNVLLSRLCVNGVFLMPLIYCCIICIAMSNGAFIDWGTIHRAEVCMCMSMHQMI